jgi:RNA polymerase sigma factor (sigma-70 family)
LIDESLINLCKRCDAKAQRALYEKLSGKMYRVCYRYLQNPLDAEDALVNGFVKIFHHLKTLEYKGKEATEAWMKKIMVNECLMFLRRQKALKYISDESIRAFEPITEPVTDLEAEEIYSLILKLPHGYRTVFNLYVIEGYNHKEIGTLLRISENTSKTQLHKARFMLQKLLTNEGITNEK